MPPLFQNLKNLISTKGRIGVQWERANFDLDFSKDSAFRGPPLTYGVGRESSESESYGMSFGLGFLAQDFFFFGFRGGREGHDDLN